MGFPNLNLHFNLYYFIALFIKVISYLYPTAVLFLIGGVRPVCLPRPNESFPPGAACWITGWGFTQEGGASHMQKI